MGAYLSKPVTDKEFESGEDEFLSFVTCSMQGWRTSQEDSHNCIINFHDNMSLFAVYDGHGGAEVAQLCSDKLPDFIKQNAHFSSGDYSQALIDSFLSFDESILTADVQDVLKNLANIDNDKSDNDDDDDDDDDPNLLQEEARLPLSQLLKKYQLSMNENGSEEEDEIVQEEKQTDVSTTSKESVTKVQETSDEVAEDDEDEEFVVGDEEEEEDDDDDDEEEGDTEENEDEEDDCKIAVSKLQDLQYMHSSPGYDSGSTAVLAVIDRAAHTIYVANVGDSRCVLSRNGVAVDLSIDHKPEDELENARILRAGGLLTDDGRVNGGLNLSRSIGDHSYKQNKAIELKDQMISSLPDIKTIDLQPEEDEFLVLACDGIWNTFSSQELIDFIKTRLPTMELKDLITEIFTHCLAPDTLGDGTGCDNMTCVVVTFKQHIGVNGGASLCNGASTTTAKSTSKRLMLDESATTPSSDTEPPSKISKTRP